MLKSKGRTEEAVQEALPYSGCADDGLSGADSEIIQAAVVSLTQTNIGKPQVSSLAWNQT